jgi:hypothetical protein
LIRLRCRVHCGTQLQPDTPWVLPTKEIHDIFEAGHGTAPGLIYARGVPDTPHPGKSTINRKLRCTLILLEVCFGRDLGCDKKYTEKTKKYRQEITLGGERSLSPSPSATREQRSHGPSTTSPPPSPRSAQEWTTPTRPQAHRSPSPIPTQGATTTACSSR